MPYERKAAWSDPNNPPEFTKDPYVYAVVVVYLGAIGLLGWLVFG
jgi:hypothetical protein